MGLLVFLICNPALSFGSEEDVRGLMEKIILFSGDNQQDEIVKLAEFSDPAIKIIVEAWRVGEVYSYEKDGKKIALQQTNVGFVHIATGEVLNISENDSGLNKDRPSRKIRKDLKRIVDTADLIAMDPEVRKDAALKLGLSQSLEYFDDLLKRAETEKDEGVKKSFQEAIAISKLGHGTDEEKLESIRLLGELKSFPGKDFIANIMKEAKAGLAEGEEETELILACKKSIQMIESHQSIVDFFGNLFRGISLGSVLLIVSFGLAITFGLMGIINMAHGEFIAIGGYTCYVVQNLFISWFGQHSTAYEYYYLVSIPICFVVAAFIGFLLEKSCIQFLYRRPLESLLATWGISMVMQQMFRLIFGAANVQVNTPEWMIHSVDVSGVAMSYSRLFVVGFAILVIIMTWLLLSKTSLGLHIRAVMQNRKMASSLGIPVAKVNSLTFAYGCGLASLAGAALSLIGNVGPSMGQTYIVDSFMVVVIGSVGNLLGAGLSSMGIGVVDQYLQPVLGPVMGKITVFFVIILFLQWKPGGLFPTKSRSMDD
jgi:urea transport system permease protein